jgi:hypothetical protein
MTSTDKAECTTTECDNVDSVNILVRVPPFWSDDVLCFAMLEAQFGVAGEITSGRRNISNRYFKYRPSRTCG